MKIGNENIYSLIKDFYDKHHAAEAILARSMVDRYIRKKIWSGVSEDDLKESWPALELVLLYMTTKKLESLYQLTMYDYQLMLWMSSHEELGDNVYFLTENNIKYFCDELKAFYDYYTDGSFGDDDKLSFMLEEFRKSVYLNDVFDFPEIDENDELFNILIHMDEMENDDAVRMNMMLEQLVNRMGDYFHANVFAADIGRAMFFFCDPDLPEEEKMNSEFWYSFWDYFLFDYHLIENDMLPVHYFYKKEYKRLTAGDRIILRDLMNAKFQIFEVLSYRDGMASCRDLLTDEEFEVPAPSVMVADCKDIIMFGHTHRSGAMLVNYLTQYNATPKLRQRIKAEIMYQFEMFRCQKPKATIADFSARHSAVIRHLVIIFVTRAQLGVAEIRQLPAPMKRRKKSILSQADRKMFAKMVTALGISVYSARLAVELYVDAIAAGSIGDWDKYSSEVMCAVILLYARINHLDMVKPKDVISCFEVRERDVVQLEEWIMDDLQLTVSDPRYLAEEGFIGALYADL